MLMNDLMILQFNKDTVLQLTLAQYTILSVRLCLRQMYVRFYNIWIPKKSYCLAFIFKFRNYLYTPFTY